MAKAPELVRAAAPGAEQKLSKTYNYSKESNDGEVWESCRQDSSGARCAEKSTGRCDRAKVEKADA